MGWNRCEKSGILMCWRSSAVMQLCGWAGGYVYTGVAWFSVCVGFE